MARKESEREIIFSSAKRRPYGAKITLLLERYTQFPIKGDCVLLVSPEIIVRMVPSKDASEGEKQQQWDIFVEGFATAGEAEQAGLKIALGFLWAALSGRYAMRLIYDNPLPCTVYDRTQQKGLTITGKATLIVTKAIANIMDPVNTIISSPLQIDQKLLVAAELFTAARLETTERARFVGLVSSLEPFAIQQKYNSKELTALIQTFKEHLQKSRLDDTIKGSLIARIEQLKVESVSRAIKRLVEETLPNDPAAADLIEEAYALRSKILHEGSTDAALEFRSREVENVVHQIFKVKIKQYFH